jgi:transposase-like protein
MSERMAPLHCPYCGEEDLRPHAEEASGAGAERTAGHGGWECRSCARVFAVKFLGLASRALEVTR